MIVTAYLGLGSRYSYLASTQLDRIARDTGAKFDWVPLNSSELIRRSRRGPSPLEGDIREGAYAPAYRDSDLRRWAAYYGVPYRDPDLSGLPPAALALACWTVADSHRRDLMLAIYAALFDKGPALDIDRLGDIAAEFGSGRDQLAEALNGGKAQGRHAAALDQALKAGAFGVPTFVVGGALSWGNDRLPLLERHLRDAAG